MRAVIDTNVLLSALLWHGTPHALMEHVRSGALSMVSSPALLAELAEVIEPPRLPQPVCPDPDDDHVLACALAAQCDLVVSGDADLLNLREYQSIRIVAVTEALRPIESEE